MAFEGEHKVIPIKGIARAGADTVCEDGAMNEVIGLEYKDGSYVPIKPTNSFRNHSFSGSSIIFHNTSKGDNIISNIRGELKWARKESASVDENINWELFGSVIYDSGNNIIEDNRESVFGNHLCVIGDTLTMLCDGVQRTYIYDGKHYAKVEEDFTAYSNSLFRFRVTQGIAGHDDTKNFDGNMKPPKYVQYLLGEEYGGIDGTAGAIKSRWSELMAASHDVPLGASLLTKAKGLVTEKGGLSGYFLVCYALRLTNGSLVCASSPMLMGPPNIKQRGNLTPHNIDVEKGDYSNCFVALDVPTHNTGGSGTSFVSLDLGNLNMNNDRIGLSSGVLLDGKRVEFGVDKEAETEGLSSENLQFVFYRKDRWSKDVDYDTLQNGVADSGRQFFYPRLYLTDEATPSYKEQADNAAQMVNTGIVPFNSMITIWVENGDISSMGGGDAESSRFIDAIFKTQACTGLSNKLQIAIDKNLLKSLPNTVSSVCVFMSPEINPFSDTTNDNYVTTHGPFFSGILHKPASTNENNFRITHTFTPQYRDNDSVIEDIRNIQSLYKVKEYYKEELLNIAKEDESEWIDVDLRGILGDSLLTRESLPITAFDFSKYSYGVLSSYNYRLHAANIKKELYNGYKCLSHLNLGDNGVGQFYNETPRPEQGVIRKFVTKTYIKNNDGSESVVVQEENNLEINSIHLNGFIMYPNPDAYKMDIYIYESLPLGFDNDHKITIDLIPNKRLGFSYYLNKDLKIIDIDDIEDSSFSLSDMVAKNKTIQNKNGMRVSDVAAPTIFPAKNTSLVGDGEIIGFARITMTMTQDTYGRNPLFVFCTDGIYTMEVDTTGNSVYTTATFLDNEVCINPNSICEISGGALFASERGLMVVSQNGVSEFAPTLSGDVMHLPTYQKNGQNDYSKGYGLYLYGKIADQIPEDNFLDYLKDLSTHIVFLPNKKQVIIYNPYRSNCYLIDIATKITTQLNNCFQFNSENHHDVLFHEKGLLWSFSQKPVGNKTLLQTRPIKVDRFLKSSYRVILRGKFSAEDVDTDEYSSLLVLGSLDGEHWQPIGIKEKKISDGAFHDIGCVTDRVSVKYIMVIFASYLDKDSHIDHLELTLVDKYNNKLR